MLSEKIIIAQSTLFLMTFFDAVFY